MTPEKRETAIKWLQEEARSLRLAPKINGCGPENWADLLEVMETCLEAVRGHGSEPLTLEQLREMENNRLLSERCARLEEARENANEAAAKWEGLCRMAEQERDQYKAALQNWYEEG